MQIIYVQTYATIGIGVGEAYDLHQSTAVALPIYARYTYTYTCFFVSTVAMLLHSK
jgi:hypothetical protein